MGGRKPFYFCAFWLLTDFAPRAHGPGARYFNYTTKPAICQEIFAK